MSKKELDELRERRGREGSREHSPSRQRAWGPSHGPPLPPGPYPPPHYAPYMMAHSMRPGGECHHTTSPSPSDSLHPHSSSLWQWACGRRQGLPPTSPPDGLRQTSLPPIPTPKPLRHVRVSLCH